MGTVRIGISGWRYQPWRGVFYPKSLLQREELHFASRQFETIEVNGSFYSLQHPRSYAAWYAQTPPGFVFAIKGSRYITHIRRLRDIDKPLANFFASGLFNLREKLGPFLWQFPPNFSFDAGRLERFFQLLPRTTGAALALARRRDSRMTGRAKLAIDADRPLRHAIEVRHTSFIQPDFIRLLRQHCIALVVADTAGKWPYMEDVTADFMYLRLHGDKEIYKSGYTPKAIARWASRIQAWRAGLQPRDASTIPGTTPPDRRDRDVYCYFDNDMKVKAPRDAHRLVAALNSHGIRSAAPRLPAARVPSRLLASHARETQARQPARNR